MWRTGLWEHTFPLVLRFISLPSLFRVIYRERKRLALYKNVILQFIDVKAGHHCL